ncbi:hypothetical protein [Wohlfahrtiimonas chitiniclastica]|uniref:hypothetical protein n=1 Tax=Wohlfahrtiimonas chitiniclastica TaxID=400946 RepID=UPI0011D1684F|nr:hypothetical protein [Wohlfahrtiimonas chitiniclastica]
MNGKFCPSCGQHQIADWVNICESCSNKRKNMVNWIGMGVFMATFALSLYWYFNQYILSIMPRNWNIVSIFKAVEYHISHLNFSSPYAYILPALLLACVLLGGLTNELMYKLVRAK